MSKHTWYSATIAYKVSFSLRRKPGQQVWCEYRASSKMGAKYPVGMRSDNSVVQTKILLVQKLLS